MSHPAPSALLTDLYELTMAAGYHDHGMHGQATFSLFLRAQPQRGFYVAAGLEPALTYLQNMRFGPDDIDHLRKSGRFSEPFLKFLQQMRFEGEVWALSEGTLFFPEEPIMEITAPLLQAQVVETFLINTIGLNTLLATKAARCVHAAQGRQLIDFSLRRTQGEMAGIVAARSAYLAGFDATSNLLASKRYGIPVAGTMAHSFVQAFDNEADAFLAYVQTFPHNAVLLIDTYDTIGGAHAAVKVAQHMEKQGNHLAGVRLDSGDMIAMSHQVRAILNGAGLPHVKIYASGGFDEFAVAKAVRMQAAIDTFGVGTKVGVSADLPYLNIVYKMVRYNNRDVLKRSPGKETLAGKKQVFRKIDKHGIYAEDILGMREEQCADGRSLLNRVMQGGQLCRPLPSIHHARVQFDKGFRCLPQAYKALFDPPVYPVQMSSVLQGNQLPLLS